MITQKRSIYEWSEQLGSWYLTATESEQISEQYYKERLPIIINQIRNLGDYVAVERDYINATEMGITRFMRIDKAKSFKEVREYEL